MRDLRAFLRHHIEAFLDHEFGPVTEHNVTPPGVRRPVWTPDHTERLVAHLAGNWAPVQAPTHRAGCAYCPTRFSCTCGNPGQRHMCPRCDDAAEESKMSGEFPIGDLDDQADEARQAEAYEASLEQDDGEENRVRQQEEADNRQAAVLDGEALPW